MFPLLSPSAGDAFSGAMFDQNPCKINKKLWIPWFGRTGTLLKRTSAKRWSKKWYSNVWAMKSDQFRTKSSFFGSFRMWQKHYQNKAIYWRETLKKSILEQNAEIVPSALRVRCGQYFLLQIGTFSGFAAIFLTANALCSPVRKENPASRACGKKNTSCFATVSYTHLTLPPILLV